MLIVAMVLTIFCCLIYHAIFTKFPNKKQQRKIAHLEYKLTHSDNPMEQVFLQKQLTELRGYDVESCNIL